MTPATGSAEGSATEASPGLGNLLDELSWRGMLHDTTPGLPARLASGRPIAGYNGFDPSGPSLHVGHLVPIFGLLQFQRHGGRPVALLGGGTGMIGDPSGTSAERNLLDRETLDALMQDHRLLVTVEDGAVVNGFGAHLAGVAETAAPDVRVVPLGVPDRTYEHAPRAEQLALVGLTGAGIAARVRALAAEESLTPS